MIALILAALMCDAGRRNKVDIDTAIKLENQRNKTKKNLENRTIQSYKDRALEVKDRYEKSFANQINFKVEEWKLFRTAVSKINGEYPGFEAGRDMIMSFTTNLYQKWIPTVIEVEDEKSQIDTFVEEQMQSRKSVRNILKFRNPGDSNELLERKAKIMIPMIQKKHVEILMEIMDINLGFMRFPIDKCELVPLMKAALVDLPIPDR